MRMLEIKALQALSEALECAMEPHIHQTPWIIQANIEQAITHLRHTRPVGQKVINVLDQIFAESRGSLKPNKRNKELLNIAIRYLVTPECIPTKTQSKH